MADMPVGWNALADGILVEKWSVEINIDDLPGFMRERTQRG